MSFVRNFNKQLVKRAETFQVTKKEVRTVRTVIAKPKESTGFYKIKKYFSTGNTQMMDTQNRNFKNFNFEMADGSRLF